MIELMIQKNMLKEMDEMIKKKLQAKGLNYIDKSFDTLPSSLNTDRAPVMAITETLGDVDVACTKYLTSPTEINNWIKEA